MNIPIFPSRFAVAFGFLVSLGVATAQPYIVSVVPSRGETGVSPTTTIRFTFSKEMNPGATAASLYAFLDTDFQLVTATAAWGSGNTILTCTPTAPLPAGYTVVWSVDGEDSAFGIPMDNDVGMFTVSGGGSSGTGCDPAVPMYSFTVSKGWLYQQNSGGSPVLDAGNPYCFLACTTIPCPTGATNVSLRMPIGIEVNEKGTGIPGHVQHLDCSYGTPAALDAAYGTGDYRFTVQATASNMPVTVNFPTFTQPSAPHVSNWAAAQAIDPTQPFGLAWDAMAGGTVADCIYVEIYGGVFKTPALGEAGALTGTATSITIPANTLEPDQNYQGSITFYHYQILTNGSSHVTLAYRASVTEFQLNTTSGSGSPLVINNTVAAIATGKFTFDVTCSPGQNVIIERSTSLQPDSWAPIFTTNAITSAVHITDDLAAGNRFYRARKGP